MKREGQETIELVDGKPCIRYIQFLSNEPKKMVLYWPIDFNGQFPVEFVGVEAHNRSSSNGIYTFRRSSYDWVDIRLKDGGKTQPIKTEIFDVPPPKTKKELRWECGRWEKLLKSGWVTA